MASILIVEDHSIVREGVRSYIGKRTEHSVVAETGDGLDALDLIAEHRPDIAIVDLRLPGLDGLEVVRRTTETFKDIKCIVLSMHAGAIFVTKALQNGALAYVLKNSAVDDLGLAIEAALDNRQFISAGVERVDRDAVRPTDAYESLTPRERETLQLVAEGLTASEIAKKLYISSRTVEKHRSNLMKKLNLHNHAEVVRYALERGLVPFRLPDAS